MRYLLDTNVCIEILRGRNPALKTRLPFDDSAAAAYGEIRAHLQRAGRLIGGNDLLIAAIAQTNNLTLVTHNTGEFTRVPNLPVEDWQA